MREEMKRKVLGVLVVGMVLVTAGCNEEGIDRVQARAGDVVCTIKENTLENVGLAVGLTTDIAVATDVMTAQQVSEGQAVLGQVMDVAREPIETLKTVAGTGCRSAVTQAVGTVRQMAAQ